MINQNQRAHCHMKCPMKLEISARKRFSIKILVFKTPENDTSYKLVGSNWFSTGLYIRAFIGQFTNPVWF